MLNRFINKSLLIQHSKQLRYYSSRTESSSTTGNEPDPQLGGYPQFIPLSAQEKNPYGTYWDKQGRFNFGETLHEDEDVLGIHAPDVHKFTYGESARSFLYTIIGFAGFGYFASGLIPERNVAPRDYPRSGLQDELGKHEDNKAREFQSVEDGE